MGLKWTVGDGLSMWGQCTIQTIVKLAMNGFGGSPFVIQTNGVSFLGASRFLSTPVPRKEGTKNIVPLKDGNKKLVPLKDRNLVPLKDGTKNHVLWKDGIKNLVPLKDKNKNKLGTTERQH